MAKKKEEIIDEIDAFIESELTPKKKRSTKKEVVKKSEIKEDKPNKTRTLKKKEVPKEEVKEELIKEKVVEKKQEEVKVSKKVSKNKDIDEDEDLYLTKSFKPLKPKKRFKRGVLKFFRNVILLGLLAVVGYFGYIKLKDIYVMSKPVNVYKEVFKELGNVIVKELDVIPDAKSFKVDVSVDTNMTNYDKLNGNIMNYEFVSTDFGYKDFVGVNDKGVYTLKTNDIAYVRYSGSDNVFKADGRESQIIEMISPFFKYKEDMVYIVNTNVDIINKILEDNDIKSKNEELYINDVTLDVRCNTLNFSQDFVNRYLEEVFKNKLLVDKMARVYEMSTDEFKVEFEKDMNSLVDDVQINVYLYKFELVGIDVELDGFIEAYLYAYDKEYDAKINGIFGIIGLEGEEANFHMSNRVDSDNTVVILDDLSNSFSLDKLDGEDIAFGNTKINIKSNKLTYEYKKGDKYATVTVNFSKGSDLVIDTDNLISTTKKINKEHTNFENSLTNNEKVSFNVVSAYVYGLETE